MEPPGSIAEIDRDVPAAGGQAGLLCQLTLSRDEWVFVRFVQQPAGGSKKN